MEKPKSTLMAYALSLLGFTGLAGIHRFYLGKPITGILWLLTGGVFGVGTIYDLITMDQQVSEANSRIRGFAENGKHELYGQYAEDYAPPEQAVRLTAQSLEHLIFLLAQDSHGVVSVAQLALESGIPADQAQFELDTMVAKEHAVLGERTNGLKVYVFREFLSRSVQDDLIF